ncbi:hypothetical protein MPNT_220008 [Candidatus Methylacidithermus pantelleriae]|uniref:Uncharacterized protein n=1 Tax=Candidatus Methylacidithermus pantelleriae TaxID=2744239 RepID=A0A8J2FSM5_9BACT|nr:hypothetical protein MPNT_220008 [Candidatus Methylacidithermus pantelleriae]
MFLLFLDLCQGDRDGSKSAFFAAGVEGIEVDQADTAVMGVVDHGRRHGTSFYEGAASRSRPEGSGALRMPIRARRSRG